MAAGVAGLFFPYQGFTFAGKQPGRVDQRVRTDGGEDLPARRPPPRHHVRDGRLGNARVCGHAGLGSPPDLLEQPGDPAAGRVVIHLDVCFLVLHGFSSFAGCGRIISIESIIEFLEKNKSYLYDHGFYLENFIK